MRTFRHFRFFPKTSEDFRRLPTIFEDFKKIQKCWKVILSTLRQISKIFQRFPKISEEFRRFPMNVPKVQLRTSGKVCTVEAKNIQQERSNKHPFWSGWSANYHKLINGCLDENIWWARAGNNSTLYIYNFRKPHWFNNVFSLIRQQNHLLDSVP